MKKVVFLLATVAIAFGFSSTALAFHSGGVGHCDGCHTMHNSENGATVIPGGTVGTGINSYLTVGADPSSTCLSCHIRIYKAMSTDGSAYTPGGDFYWMTQDFSAFYPRDDSEGFRHGHNVVAATYGIAADPVLSTGPSNGTVNYPAGQLGCNSCHDPHGKIANNANPAPISASGSYGAPEPADGSVLGNYRLLGGLGYDGGEQVSAAGISFISAAPIARAYPGAMGQWPAETDTNHVAYGLGMSEWCSNCHSGFTAGMLEHRHPAGAGAYLFHRGVAYNTYRATGDLTNTQATAYDRLVPFERGITDVTLLDTSSTFGADMPSRAMCLTCHRAHASPFDNAGRWDFTIEIITEAVGPLASADAIDVYYGEDIASRYNPWQRSLCNKCHIQD